MTNDKQVQKVFIKKLNCKQAILNLAPTILGVFVAFLLIMLMLTYLENNSEALGALYPVAIVLLIPSIIRVLDLIPRPIATYDIVELESSDVEDYHK